MAPPVLCRSAANELVQVAYFEFGFIRAFKLSSQSNKQPVLAKRTLLTPIGYIQREKRFIPDDDTVGTFDVKWSVSL